MTLDLRHLMTVDLDGVLPTNELGETPFGRRRIVAISGGRFEGDRLSGKVLPVGGDWALIRRDGVFAIDVRALLQTDDGALVSFNYTGRWHASPDEMARLLRREGDLGQGDYYYRINAVFEAASESRYDWLNRIVAVGRGQPKIFGSIYDVYEVL